MRLQKIENLNKAIISSGGSINNFAKSDEVNEKRQFMKSSGDKHTTYLDIIFTLIISCLTIGTVTVIIVFCRRRYFRDTTSTRHSLTSKTSKKRLRSTTSKRSRCQIVRTNNKFNLKSCLSVEYMDSNKSGEYIKSEQLNLSSIQSGFHSGKNSSDIKQSLQITSKYSSQTSKLFPP